MSDDITFCFNTHCGNKTCERNPKNIRIPYRPHSYGFYKDCEYWDVPDTYSVAQTTDEQGGAKWNGKNHNRIGD